MWQKRLATLALIIGGLTCTVGGMFLIAANKEPERGSEAWCDKMLEVAHVDWQEADFQLFAASCLNPEPIEY